VKIHEYQAKALLREFGVAVPRGDVADSPARAHEIARALGGRVVVKAQVHAGGRGKAGGIQLAESPSAAEAAAKQILGMRLRTPQTPPEGIEVRRVLVEDASPVRAELYLAVTLDRARSTEVVMASQAVTATTAAICRARPTGLKPRVSRRVSQVSASRPAARVAIGAATGSRY